jgi:hypothetical protein
MVERKAGVNVGRTIDDDVDRIESEREFVITGHVEVPFRIGLGSQIRKGSDFLKLILEKCPPTSLNQGGSELFLWRWSSGQTGARCDYFPVLRWSKYGLERRLWKSLLA